MEKLIYVFHNSDECTYSCDDVTPIEYTSKQDFIFDLLDEYNKYKKEDTFWGFPLLNTLGREKWHFDDMYKQDIVENTYTLEDWFNKFKV